MVLDTLPPLAPVGRRPAGATAAATGPVLWPLGQAESTWNALGLAQGQSDEPRRWGWRPCATLGWEPIGNGTVVRLPLQPHQHAYSRGRNNR